jgi:hypothetical protein
MYAPPRHLSSDDLPELLRYLGGTLAACRLLDVSQRTMRRWLTEKNAPLGYVRLAWYASPHGRDAADNDATNQLRLQQQQLDALQLKLDRRLPLNEVPRYLADACNEAVFTMPVPTQRAGAPTWHPAHPRNRRRNSSEQSESA